MSKKLIVNYEDLTFVEVLGSGITGIVKLMKHADGISYAVKFPAQGSLDVMSDLYNEYDILNTLELAGIRDIIPKAYHFERNVRNCFMVTEPLGQSLWQEIEERSFYFSETEALQIGLQLLPHVKKIHEAGVCHGDIAPQNIVRRGSGIHGNNLCLIDFERGEKECNFFGSNEDSNVSFNEICGQDIHLLSFSVLLLAGAVGAGTESRLHKLDDDVSTYVNSLVSQETVENDDEWTTSANPVDYKVVKKLMSDVASSPGTLRLQPRAMPKRYSLPQND